MNLQRYTDVAAFYAQAEPLLLRNEAANCLPIGLCTTLMVNSAAYSQEPPYFATVSSGDGVVAAAVMTPPYNLTLVQSDHPAALDLIAQDVFAAYRTLPGVLGPAPLSKRFAELWQGLAGQPHQLAVAEQIYQLDAVQPLPTVEGRFRLIMSADRDQLIEWIRAFDEEAHGPGAPAHDPARPVDQALVGEVRRFFVWEVDGALVTLAGTTGSTPNGVRVGPVYTPPEQRRKGYASACVAALSQLLLDEGRRFCFLFTDLANPISNHIYQVIGYQPVVDVDVYAFGEQTMDD